MESRAAASCLISGKCPPSLHLSLLFVGSSRNCCEDCVKDDIYRAQQVPDLVSVHCTHECAVAQSCPTLCSPMDCSLPGPSVHGIFQARILKWVAISSSRGSSPTQGSNLDLPHWQVDSLLSEPPGNHRLNEGRRSCKPMRMGLLSSNNTTAKRNCTYLVQALF